MSPEKKKTVSRIAVSGAFIMALSCTAKITAFHLNAPVVAQWINVVMNAIIVLGCYKLGKLVNLSRTHRWLCETALFGYAFYAGLLIFIPKSSTQEISASVLIFFILTLAMSVWFLFDLMRSDLKEAEENLKKLEKELEE